MNGLKAVIEDLCKKHAYLVSEETVDAADAGVCETVQAWLERETLERERTKETRKSMPGIRRAAPGRQGCKRTAVETNKVKNFINRLKKKGY